MVATKKQKYKEILGTGGTSYKTPIPKSNQYEHKMNWDQRSWRKQPKKHTKSDQKILKKIPDIKKDPN